MKALKAIYKIIRVRLIHKAGKDMGLASGSTTSWLIVRKARMGDFAVVSPGNI